MYIIELLIEYIQKRRYAFKQPPNVADNSESEICKHIYIPIDSTMDYLACSNCGDVIKNTKKPDDKADNFFNNPKDPE